MLAVTRAGLAGLAGIAGQIPRDLFLWFRAISLPGASAFDLGPKDSGEAVDQRLLCCWARANPNYW